MFPPEHTDKGLQRLIEEMPMIAKSKAGQPGSPKPYQSNDAEERIRRRAYELYEQRGRVDEFALDDLLQAEHELLGAQRQPKVKAARGSRC